jgi:hypothetical protein
MKRENEEKLLNMVLEIAQVVGQLGGGKMFSDDIVKRGQDIYKDELKPLPTSEGKKE